MKLFKVRFLQHHALKITRGWCIVQAATSEEAEQFAQRDLVSKVPGYAYVVEVKELITLKEGKAQYVAGDFISAPEIVEQLKDWYNDERTRA